jgi:hypothetical protein
MEPSAPAFFENLHHEARLDLAFGKENEGVIEEVCRLFCDSPVVCHSVAMVLGRQEEFDGFLGDFATCALRPGLDECRRV